MDAFDVKKLNINSQAFELESFIFGDSLGSASPSPPTGLLAFAPPKSFAPT